MIHVMVIIDTDTNTSSSPACYKILMPDVVCKAAQSDNAIRENLHPQINFNNMLMKSDA